MTNILPESNQIKYKLKLINAKDTYLVRHPVLREGKPIESCIFDGDNLVTTMHVGLFIDKYLIGVSSFMKNNNNLFSDTNQYQLRGMAVLKPYQKKGFGKAIINYAESMLKNNSTIIWCNARKVAVAFYQKNNYQIIDAPFNIGDIGVHYVMYKTLEFK